MNQHILLIDDDALLVKSLAFTLTQNGYRATTATSAHAGLALIEQDPPDLILLDIGLPDLDGLTVLRRIQQGRALPVIFLTARRRELDEVLGLELGAEDYITKPYNEDVLLARIKTVLRRDEAARRAEAANREERSIDRVEDKPNGRLVVGDVTIDPAAHIVTLHDRPVDLAPKAFELLRVLAVNSGQVMSLNDLLEQVWGPEFMGEPQVVYVHIRWLREKLEDDASQPKRIVTVRGVGYKLLP
jgi:DNA-binding response OmpR family regulator